MTDQPKPIDLSIALSQFGTNYAPLEIDKSIHDSFLSKYANVEFLGKFLNICLYQSDFSAIAGINSNAEIIRYFKVFLKSLGEDIKSIKNVSINSPTKPFLDTITFLTNLLNIKEDITGRLISYDTVNNHFPNLNPFTKQILATVISTRIDNFQKFKSELEDVSKLITVYHELKQVKFISEELEVLKVEANNNNVSPLNLLKIYKEIIHKAYNTFSTLKTVSEGDESSKYLEFYDETCLDETSDKLLKYLSESFNFYSSGYQLLDKYIDGIESTATYLISAASNNGKSLFMLNMMRKLIMHDLNEFKSNDMILFITLEDDIYKLFRRIMCVFGNINPKLAKKLFVSSSNLIKTLAETDIQLTSVKQQVKELLEKIIEKAIHSTTRNKCRVGLIHSNRMDYCCNDIVRFIDKKRIEGITVKICFIDYLDMMQPSSTVSGSKGFNDYDNQGEIMKEMRNLGKDYHIPVLTVTQNSKLAENQNQSLNNSLIGDSYKKIRYVDYTLMLRQSDSLSITSPEVLGDVLDPGQNMGDLTLMEYQSSLVPMQLKITKAKDGTKNDSKYMIFNPHNLRIYDTFAEVAADMAAYKQTNEDLLRDIEAVGLVINDSDILFSDENESIDPFDNLLI